MRKNIYRMMILFGLAGLLGCGKQASLEKQAERQVEAEEQLEASGQPKQQEESQKVPKIYVQVSGAVVSPGVYPLPEGSRVFEAVQLAGGTTEEADTVQMNQAEVLSDGQMVYVKTKEEAQNEVVLEEEQSDGKVNLNTAAEEELMTLPGIGQAKARSILAWRETNGKFSQIEDLMQIEGIKEGVFSKIKDSVKVN